MEENFNKGINLAKNMLDGFSKEKSDFLGKKDKSRKGSIDKGIIKIVNEINSKSGYYTTSSCVGRIVLLEMKSKKKNECGWIFAKHDEITFKEINNALKKHSIKNNFNNEKFNKNKSNNYEIWLKQQPLILHVACRNLEAAKRLLELSRRIFRRAGIIGITDRKVTVEIIGSEHLETIVKDKDFVADEDYLKNLVKYANMNFMENRRKIERFFNLITNKMQNFEKKLEK
ncbi:hypothetical protein HY637_04620 [Candidatus Woesearchaeota archaeon]|nr:hypothetical protein [Candidatus Woesearchaeota archaeon]